MSERNRKINFKYLYEQQCEYCSEPFVPYDEEWPTSTKMYCCEEHRIKGEEIAYEIGKQNFQEIRKEKKTLKRKIRGENTK